MLQRWILIDFLQIKNLNISNCAEIDKASMWQSWRKRYEIGLDMRVRLQNGPSRSWEQTRSPCLLHDVISEKPHSSSSSVPTSDRVLYIAVRIRTYLVLPVAARIYLARFVSIYSSEKVSAYVTWLGYLSLWFCNIKIEHGTLNALTIFNSTSETCIWVCHIKRWRMVRITCDDSPGTRQPRCLRIYASRKNGWTEHQHN